MTEEEIKHRPLPHSFRAEASVLGSVLVDPGVFERVDIASTDFYDPRCRTVFEAFAELRSERSPIDLGTVEVALRHAKRFDAIGGLPFLTAIAIETPTAANADHYADVVREHAVARRVMRAAEEIVAAGYRGDVGGDELLARMATAARGIDPARRRDVQDARSLARQRVSELAHALEGDAGGNHAPLRVPTGLASFDAVYGGLPRGNHTALVAPTGHGKTAVAHHIAFHSPAPALIFTFEELRRDAVDRFMAARTGLPGVRITAGRLNGREFATLVAAVDDVPTTVHFVDARGMSDVDVARSARRNVPALGVGVVIVDYLNRVKLSASPRLRTDERMREAVSIFDNACGELDCAWLTCAQVNRAANKENRAPRITDARECAAIEEYSKLGFVVYRPNRNAGEEYPDDIVQIIVDKANVGKAPEAFEFSWNGPTMAIGKPIGNQGGM